VRPMSSLGATPRIVAAAAFAPMTTPPLASSSTAAAVTSLGSFIGGERYPTHSDGSLARHGAWMGALLAHVERRTVPA